MTGVYGADYANQTNHSRSIRPTVIQGYGGTIDITETGQTLFGMEQMLSFAAANLNAASSQEEFDIAYENYQIVYQAYEPYITRERSLRGLEAADTYAGNFGNGKLP